MSDSVSILTVCGSLRAASFNRQLEEALPSFASDSDLKCQDDNE